MEGLQTTIDWDNGSMYVSCTQLRRTMEELKVTTQRSVLKSPEVKPVRTGRTCPRMWKVFVGKEEACRRKVRHIFSLENWGKSEQSSLRWKVYFVTTFPVLIYSTFTQFSDRNERPSFLSVYLQNKSRSIGEHSPTESFNLSKSKVIIKISEMNQGPPCVFVLCAAPPAVLPCSGEPPAGMKGEFLACNGLLRNDLQRCDYWLHAPTHTVEGMLNKKQLSIFGSNIGMDHYSTDSFIHWLLMSKFTHLQTDAQFDVI